MARKMKPGHKRCPSCGSLVKGPRTKTCPKCNYQFNGKHKAVATKPAEAPAPAVAEKPVKAADTVTLDQIKAVARTVKAVGGLGRLNELLGLIREVGGVKKFKDLAEAMTIPATDAIPF